MQMWYNFCFSSFFMHWWFQGHPRAAAMQKSQVWDGVYIVVLVEGQDMPEGGQGDIFVRFKLGEQRFRSKVRFMFLNILFYVNSGCFICSPFYITLYVLYLYLSGSTLLCFTVWLLVWVVTVTTALLMLVLLLFSRLICVPSMHCLSGSTWMHWPPPDEST